MDSATERLEALLNFKGMVITNYYEEMNRILILSQNTKPL